jgi:hypothetical protein
MIPTDLPDRLGKVYNLFIVKNIRIAFSAVMYGWECMILTLKSFGLEKGFSKKGLGNNTSMTRGKVPGGTVERWKRCFGHNEMSGMEIWVILTY